MEYQHAVENISIVSWNPVDVAPEECSYVLIKCLDEDGTIVCESAAYEQGNFFYIYDRTAWGEIRKEIILGWSYYPFDPRL